MEKFESSPPVRNLSERNSTNFLMIGLIILGGIAVVAIIGVIVYVVINQEPNFNESYANSMVDNVFAFTRVDEIPVCDHTIIIPKFNDSSNFHREVSCIKVMDQRFPIHEASFPYYERSFACEVRGVNVTTRNKFSHERCRYDGDFKIELSVSNKTSGSLTGGNPFKLIKIQVKFEQKTDYSKRLGKMVKGFSWATGERIANYVKEIFEKDYAHEDYFRAGNYDGGDDDPEMCLNFWPCPTSSF